MLVDAPAKQNASAMHTSTSSRSNSSGGSTDPLRSAVSNHEIGNVSKALGSQFQGFRPIFAPFRFP
jgi:hypothetical protein